MLSRFVHLHISYSAQLTFDQTFEFLERQTSIDPDKEGFIPNELDPSFEFRDIGFTYPARPHQVLISIPVPLCS